MSKRLLAIIIALLVAGSILGAYFGGLLALAPIDYNSNTYVVYKKEPTITDVGMLIPRGYWNDPSSAESQLLDAPSFITSWKTSGNSEGPVPLARLAVVGVLKNAHWKIYKSTGGSWELVKDTPAEITSGMPGLGGDLAALPPNPLYYFTGEINGWMRAELNAEFWSPGPVVWDGDFINDWKYSGPIIRDDARLISGRGTIKSPPELSVWYVGQTIQASVDLGSACSQKVGDRGFVSAESGFTLELYSQGSGATVKSWDLGCGPGETGRDKSGNPLTYTVQSSDFYNIGGTCKNLLKFKLLNDLFLKDETDVKTVEVGTSRPAKPQVEITAAGGTWEEGESITVKTISTETGVLYNFRVENVESGAQLVNLNRVTYDTTTFMPTVAGTYRVVVSVERECAASDPMEVIVTIKEKIPPDYKEPLKIEFDWTAVFIILGGIGLLLLGLLVPYMDIKIRLILIFGGVIAILVAVLLFMV